MFSYNTNVHEGTQYTPHELVFGKLARLPSANPPIEKNMDLTYLEYLIELYSKIYEIQGLAHENLVNAKLRYKRYYGRRLNVRTFKVGDNVYLLKEPRTKKFGN